MIVKTPVIILREPCSQTHAGRSKGLTMVSLLIEVDELPTAAELRRLGVLQMHVTLDPKDAHPPLTTIALRFAGPNAMDSARNFVKERDTTSADYVLSMN
jgi:hypothetical protein